MDDVTRINRLVILFSEQLPKLRIRYKNESFLMKLIGFILFFNKTFMTKFITTIGYTIYYPSKKHFIEKPQNTIITLSHEYVHAHDAKKINPILFSFLYLFPQILFLLIIPFAFLFGLWSLLFLIALLPLPAYFRTKFEMRGYIATMLVMNELMLETNTSENIRREELKKYAIWINKNAFKGSWYYFMWFFGVKNKFFIAIDDIISGDILSTDSVYYTIRNAVQNSKTL